MDFEKEYANLNTAQKTAVDLIDGPVIVIAGPGTGKTQLLSMRTANILRQTDALPENILCLTFTEAAADNMRSRLLKLIGKSANHVSIFTFHGFGAHIIQNYSNFFYEAPLLSQLNELGEYDLLEKLMNKLHHDNPLAKKINGAYLHLPAVARTISWVKRAGLTPDDLRSETVKNQAYFKDANKFLSQAFQVTPTPKNFQLYNELLKSSLTLLINTPSDIGQRATEELAEAIDQLDPSSRFAQSITAWRNKWLSPVKKGEWRFADQQKNSFLLQLANLYEDYQTNLTETGLYTFDDMILRTTNALDAHEELKLNLQEKYQYILVDEYQDTNGAQDKILNQLSDNPVNEGKPNLMVVGDDDQAIYRFQGADSSVMQDFINKWNPARIVLTDSYRSGQELLDLARGVILNANDRLESNDPGLSKKLISKGNTKHTKISELLSSNEIESYINTANEIKKLVDAGVNPSTIAVLAPKHKYLEELVPYLLNLDLPINYERREQVLKQPRIIEILDLIELVSAATNFNTNKLESLIPKILAGEYWQLSAQALWNIAIQAQQGRRGWLAVLEEHDNTVLNNFADAIKFLAKGAKNQSFDLILAYLMGSKSVKLRDADSWFLPWRGYYFSEEQLNSDPAGYINFMAQFDALKQAFREWQPNEIKPRTLQDFNEFINLYRKTGIRLNDNSPYTSAQDTISLMTVFRAKGLEWDNVFVLNAEEDVWGSKARSRNQSFSLPSSLKWIEPAIDSSNDLIKLFYVGLTRAQKQLYITSYNLKNTGKSADRLVWLDDLIDLPRPKPPLPASTIVKSQEYDWQDIYKTPSKDLSILLKPILASYKLSSTHLNDFLAVDRGGPKHFLFRHLLKVPDETNPNAMYGDSIHKTLEYIHKQVNVREALPETVTIYDFFNDKLINQALTKAEYKFFKKRGEDNLYNWLEQNKNNFQKSDISEHDFSSEQIVIGETKLTGKIDVIRSLSADTLAVIDYKTSLPLASWTGLSSNAAIRVNNYKRQLLFYKLLVDNSVTLRKRGQAKQGIIEFITPDENNSFGGLAYDYNESEINKLTKLVSVVWNKIINLDLPETDKYPASLKGIQSFEDDLLNGEI
jgi:DNA helicase-2/ATP-dependent DNA helicase PcrA